MKYIILFVSLLISPILFADDTGYSGGSSNSAEAPDIKASMDEARALIGDENYKQAISKLNGVVKTDRKNADAWNLLGYSNRKLGNYKKAGKAYKKALKYDPEHKGALEYQGELFIETNKLDKAKKNRDRLASLCPSGCEELDDLEKALSAAN